MANLNEDAVRIALLQKVNECGLYTEDDKGASHLLCYISGLIDMANAVIEVIRSENRRADIGSD